jgi:hypothetical protein
MAPPTVGQVEEAEKQATGLGREEARAEAFLASLLDNVLIEPRLSGVEWAHLNDAQRLTFCHALGSSLACKAEFEEEGDGASPAVRLYRAHKACWRKLLDTIVPNMASVLDSGPLKDLMESVSSMSGLAGIIQRDAETFKGVTGFLGHVKMPPAGFLLPALRVAKVDTPVLYAPTSIWREEPPFVESDLLGPQEQRWVKAYEMVMNVETRLRQLIELELAQTHGDRWWKRAVPERVRNCCEDRKAQKESEGDSAHHPLTYSYIGDLRQIILRRDNWERCFKRCFRDKSEAGVWLQKVDEYRQPVMHFRPLDDNDFLFLMAACRWVILRVSSP